MRKLVYIHSASDLDLLKDSINSFIKFNDFDEIFIFAVSNKKSAIQREKLSSFKNITFKVFSDISLVKSAINTSGLPLETLCRILLPFELKEDILYVDYDTICVQKIPEIGFDSVLYAVPDLGENIQRNKRLNINSNRDMFNAGVLFWNLSLVSNNMFLNNLKEILNSRLYSHDQDILNMLYIDEYISLSRRFNYTPLMYFRDRVLYHYNTHKFIDVIIYHAVGPMKPWNFPFPSGLLSKMSFRRKRKFSIKSLRYIIRFSL